MPQYIVRSGQNIYDVALTLHGSVEGIFDLLISNPKLTMDTKLSYGMVLNYHTELIVNRDIRAWLREHGVLPKNGEHIYNRLDIEDFIDNHIKQYHPEILESLEEYSPDEQNFFWEQLYTPKMIVRQHGQTTSFTTKLRSGHLVINWGDYSAPQIVEGNSVRLIEHCYRSGNEHIITFYGDFECEELDFRQINGIFYPLSVIYADRFKSSIKNEDLKKLIITQ